MLDFGADAQLAAAQPLAGASASDIEPASRPSATTRSRTRSRPPSRRRGSALPRAVPRRRAARRTCWRAASSCRSSAERGRDRIQLGAADGAARRHRGARGARTIRRTAAAGSRGSAALRARLESRLQALGVETPSGARGRRARADGAARDARRSHAAAGCSIRRIARRIRSSRSSGVRGGADRQRGHRSHVRRRGWHALGGGLQDQPARRRRSARPSSIRKRCATRRSSALRAPGARSSGPQPVRAGLYFPLLAAWREVRRGSSKEPSKLKALRPGRVRRRAERDLAHQPFGLARCDR